MDWKKRALLAVAAFVCALICSPPAARSCGPELDLTVFTEKTRPDAPLDMYLRGGLGILEPGYRRIYLVAAYRRLTGPAFDSGETTALRALMDAKFDSEGAVRYDGGADQDEDAGLKEWIEARRRAAAGGADLGASPAEEPGVSESYYQGPLNFRNCLDDAFKTAARTLDERIKQSGAASPGVSQWIQAQDQVFSNCSGKESIPAPPEQGANPLIARDRAYQIAAAYFYSQNFDKAKELFETIGNDPESPWRRAAPYLIGRALLRKATLTGSGESDESSKDPQKMEEERRQTMERLVEAEKQFLKVLDDPQSAEFHPAARRLLQLVRYKLHPVESRSNLTEAILRPSPEAGVDKIAADYTVLLDRLMRERVGAESFAAMEIFSETTDRTKAVAELVASLDPEGDMTDWILTFQADGDASLDRALKKFDEKGSLPWLIAVLSKITPAHPRFSDMADKASWTPKDSPGHVTVGYHLARLAMEAGKRDEARKMLDELLGLSGERSVPRSAMNRLLTLRLAAAQNLDEFIRYAPRIPARVDGVEGTPTASYFDEDATFVINARMPGRMLLETAQNGALPENLRIALGRALWVRALLLDNDALALTAANFLKESDATMRPHLQSYLAAKDPKARRYQGILTVMRLPGLRPFADAGRERVIPMEEIDSYRDNWWATPQSVEKGKTEVKKTEPLFMSPEQKAEAAKEFKALSALGSAPTFLCRFAAITVKSSPSAPNLAEALHLAVRSTRYGMTDDETGKYSKEAFELLHNKYSKSEWAQKTPYWFK